MRAVTEPAQPWPMDAQHLILKIAYFDFDVPSVATRFAPDPRVTNTSNNIIGVQFLSRFGAEPINGGHLFHYRVGEMQDMISTKIKGDRLMFNCLPSIN